MKDEMTETHPFDHAIELDTIDANIRRGRTHPEWGNMVGPFGGITAAALIHAIQTHPDRIGDPLALTVNFAAAIADGDFDITLRAARTNRTTQHWILELSQDGDIKTTATALFGLRRDTWGDTEAIPPSAPPPEQIAPSDRQGTVVVWARLYDMRFAEGSLPGEDPQPSPSSTTTLWVRDNAERQVDYPALAALCDIFYPRAFLRRGSVLPAGTISLTTYFHADQQQLEALDGDYVLATAHANRFSNGYFDQSAQVWSRDGVLLATTHQIVYFKG
jgi:acyl-CoA thioesterase